MWNRRFCPGQVEFIAGDIRSHYGIRDIKRGLHDVECGITEMEKGHVTAVRNSRFNNGFFPCHCRCHHHHNSCHHSGFNGFSGNHCDGQNGFNDFGNDFNDFDGFGGF